MAKGSLYFSTKRCSNGNVQYDCRKVSYKGFDEEMVYGAQLGLHAKKHPAPFQFRGKAASRMLPNLYGQNPGPQIGGGPLGLSWQYEYASSDRIRAGGRARPCQPQFLVCAAVRLELDVDLNHHLLQAFGRCYCSNGQEGRDFPHRVFFSMNEREATNPPFPSDSDEIQ